MDSGEDDPETETVFENGDDTKQNDESQNGESSVGICIDIWMPRLVYFQHAQHRYGVHERRICNIKNPFKSRIIA